MKRIGSIGGSISVRLGVRNNLLSVDLSDSNSAANCHPIRGVTDGSLNERNRRENKHINSIFTLKYALHQ